MSLWRSRQSLESLVPGSPPSSSTATACCVGSPSRFLSSQAASSPFKIAHPAESCSPRWPVFQSNCAHRGWEAAQHPQLLPCTEAEADPVPFSIYLDFSPLSPCCHKLTPQYLMSSSFSTKCYKIFVGFSNPVFLKNSLRFAASDSTGSLILPSLLWVGAKGLF